jgi:hypothetical protein
VLGGEKSDFSGFVGFKKQKSGVKKQKSGVKKQKSGVLKNKKVG